MPRRLRTSFHTDNEFDQFTKQVFMRGPHNVQMRSTIPVVPSKSALRALRNLALGTSFTVAFTTAVLTEDRRRRTRIAREFQSNAQKLKASNRYTAASSLMTIDSFHERLSSHQDEPFWSQAGIRKPDTCTPAVDATSLTPKSSSSLHSTGIEAEKFSLSSSHESTRYNNQRHDTTMEVEQRKTHVKDFHQVIGKSMRQHDFELEKLHSHSVNRTAEHVRIGTDRRISDLKKTAYRTLAMSKWLKQIPDYTARSKINRYLGDADLLCDQLCKWGLKELALQVLDHLNDEMRDEPYLVDYCYIRTNNILGKHSTVLNYFENVYKPSTNQVLFYGAGRAVFDSAIATGLSPGAIEKILVDCFRMAKERGILSSTTWLLTLMGYEWSDTSDITRIRALFLRMEPYFHLLSHPQAVYALVIQQCVLAGQEQLAADCYNDFKVLYPNDGSHFVIQGHLALAKALRDDWIGVDESFRSMQTLKHNSADFHQVLLPVLKEFARTHTLAETEVFLRDFLHRYKLPLTNYIQNLMIDAYGKAKEIEPLSRWIQHSISLGCSVDALSFTIILKNADRVWGFSFDQIYELYKWFRRIAPENINFPNAKTIAQLRHTAVHQARGNPQQVARNLDRLDSDGCSVAHTALTSRSVQQSMFLAMSLGQPFKALKIYREVQCGRVPLHHSHLTIAVIASLRLHGGRTDGATRLIQEAREKGGAKTGPALAMILSSQISKLEINSAHEADKIINSVKESILALEEEAIGVSDSVITSTTSVLQRQGYPRRAIEFWRTMSSRSGHPPSRLDLATATILLNAYIAIQSSDGIKWVMGVMVANNLRADKVFKNNLRAAGKTARNLVNNAQLPDDLLKFYETVIEAHEHVKTLRREAELERNQVKHKTFEIFEQALFGATAGRSQHGGVLKDHCKTANVLGCSTTTPKVVANEPNAQ